MNEDLSYMKEMETEQLIEIVINIWGFEETSYALLILYERDPQKTLLLGIDILENNKGDDYLQATVWDIILSISPKKVLNSLLNRNAKYGKVLLIDIFKRINTEYYIKINEIPDKVVTKLKESYNSLERDIRLDEKYNKFIEKVNMLE